MSLRRSAIGCLLLAWLLLGVAHIALLPPWEEFDATANYSYIQQLSDTGQIPSRSTAFLSQEIHQYASLAPMPFGQAGRWTYDAFFAAPIEIRNAARKLIHERPITPRRFGPTAEANWQVQHPPLYYAMLAPAYLATQDASLAVRLFTLRTVSYLLAWFALVFPILVFANQSASSAGWRTSAPWPIVVTALWPLLFPIWFPEMARIGNDSLCALMVSLVWWRTVSQLDRRLSSRYAIEIGVLLGLGCLTKAFFVPIAIALALFWIVRGYQSGGVALAGRNASAMAGSLLVATAIAGWWYVWSWNVFQPVLLSERTGGLASGLLEHFSVRSAVRGFAAYLATISWLGTWSFVRPPYGFFVPMMAITAIGVASYLKVLRRYGPGDLAWLPAWMATPLLVALAYYVVLQLALTGTGQAAVGRYVHVMVAPLAFGMGLGISSLWTRIRIRRVLIGLVLYAVTFSAGVSWAQVLLFSGQFTKSPAKFYQAVSPSSPMIGMPEAMSRLAVLAYPRLGAFCWIAGAALVAIGLGLLWASMRRETLVDASAAS